MGGLYAVLGAKTWLCSLYLDSTEDALQRRHDRMLEDTGDSLATRQKLIYSHQEWRRSILYAVITRFLSRK